MIRVVRCTVALSLLFLCWTGQTIAQPPPGLAQNPLAGSRVFGTKGCVRCHAVQGIGGSIGPDLGHLALHRSFFDLATAMWNHLPRMAERMRQLGISPPHLSSWETGDLVAFLFTLNYFDSPGNPEGGRQLFLSKQCVVCHQAGRVGGVIGPRLDVLPQLGSPIFVATALWNHAPAMAETMRARKIVRPTFTAAELRDLIAYLTSVVPTPTQGPLYVLPGRVDSGRELFAAKQCVECHSVKGEGGRVGPDLGARELSQSLFQFAALMWNKVPAMLETMQVRGMTLPQLRPEEMLDLVAYLDSVRYFATAGDARRGQELTRDQGCLRCHAFSGQGGSSASDLAKGHGFDSLASIIAALWNHLSVTAPEETPPTTGWPLFNPQQMADLIAFLQQVGEVRR